MFSLPLAAEIGLDNGIPYGRLTESVAMPLGETLVRVVAADSTDCMQPIFEETVTLSGGPSLLVLAGSNSDPTLHLLDDSPPELVLRLRSLHYIHGQGPLDLGFECTDPINNTVQFYSVANNLSYATLPTGGAFTNGYAIQQFGDCRPAARETGGDVIVRLLTGVGVQSGEFATIFAFGSQTEPRITFCMDEPGTGPLVDCVSQ